MSVCCTEIWPAPAASLEAGREFIHSALQKSPIVIAAHHDADGLSSAVLMDRVLERLGHSQRIVIPTGKGESAHSDSMLAKFRQAKPGALMILDMGSRGEKLLPRVSTMIIDHHQPRGLPKNVTFVSGYGCEPVATSSMLVYMLLQSEIDIEDLDWLMLLGVVGDLGASAPFPELAGSFEKYPAKHITETVALLNAARRSAHHEVETSLRVLANASSPADIANGKSADIEVLRRCRTEVQAELSRCMKTAPKFGGKVAMLRVSSGAQIHPLMATIWAGRLKKYIVMAANENYLPGRVNFSMRTKTGINLVDFLRETMPEASGEFGHGHPQASGGSLTVAEFESFLQRLGFNSPAPR